jgi:predicted dehydrogenase
MKIAIFGGGSIGTRHAANARMLGHDVDIYDVNPERDMNRAGSQPEHSDAVLICTPASTHGALAHWLLHVRNYAGPLFVEKPLALRSDAKIFQNWPHPVTMVGYNWLFHPEVQTLLSLKRERWAAGFECRTRIAEWPGADYADPVLECSHEIAVALNELGPSARLIMSLRWASGADIELTNDARCLSAITLNWDAEHVGRRLTVSTVAPTKPHSPGQTPPEICPEWSLKPSPAALDASYILELRHFLSAVESNQPTVCPFSQGLRVVEICEQVRRLAA